MQEMDFFYLVATSKLYELLTFCRPKKSHLIHKGY